MSIDVLVYGSCRVHRPIDEIAESGRCTYSVGGSRAYLHTVEEALQRLQWLKGEQIVPDEMAPFVFSRDRAPDLSAGGHREGIDADVAVLEISSEKELVCGDVRLQLNYLRTGLLAGLGAVGDAWWTEVSRKGAPSPETIETAIKSNDFNYAGYGEAEARILTDTRCVKTDDARLSSALDAFRETWGKPVVVVTHVGLPLLNGRHLKPREDFIARLGKMCGDMGIACFAPAPVITAMGRTRALEKDGADVDHYAPDFELPYGWYLLERVIKPALAKAGGTARTDAAA